MSILRCLHAAFPASIKFWFAAAVLCLGFAVSAPTVQAAPISVWGGGSGQWDTTTAHWSTSPSGPFTSTFNSGGAANFGPAGSAGTVTLSANLAIAYVNFSTSGYTLALAGKTLTVSQPLALAGATTFDFGPGTSHATFGASTSTWTGSITITNFVTGSSQLKFGASGAGLSGTNLNLITFAGFTNGGAAQIDSNGNVTPTGVSAIPEPSTYAALASLGALGLALSRRRRRSA